MGGAPTHGLRSVGNCRFPRCRRCRRLFVSPVESPALRHVRLPRGSRPAAARFVSRAPPRALHRLFDNEARRPAPFFRAVHNHSNQDRPDHARFRTERRLERPAPRPDGPRLQDARPRRTGRRAGVLRFHHLRVLRARDRPVVLSARHSRLAAPTADVRHLRGRLSRAAARRHRDGALRRPRRPQADVHVERAADVGADAPDGPAAHLRQRRHPRARRAAAVARAARRGGGRRSAGRVGVRLRARAAATHRLCVRHADGGPDHRHPARLARRDGRQQPLLDGRGCRVRVAHPVPARRRVRPVLRLPAPLAARDARVRRNEGAQDARGRNPAEGRDPRPRPRGDRIDADHVDAVGGNRRRDPDDADAAAKAVPHRARDRAVREQHRDAVPHGRLHHRRLARRPLRREGGAVDRRRRARRVLLRDVHADRRRRGAPRAALRARGLHRRHDRRGAVRAGEELSGRRALLGHLVLVQRRVRGVRRAHAGNRVAADEIALARAGALCRGDLRARRGRDAVLEGRRITPVARAARHASCLGASAFRCFGCFGGFPRFGAFGRAPVTLRSRLGRASGRARSARRASRRRKGAAARARRIDISADPVTSPSRAALRCVHGHASSPPRPFPRRARADRVDRQRGLRDHAARRDDRQRRARAHRHRSAYERRGPAMDRRRLHARARGPDAVGRRARRPVRRAPAVRRRARALRRRIVRLRHRRERGDAHRRARAARARGGRDAPELARAAQPCVRARSTAAGARGRLVDRVGRDLDRGGPGDRRRADRAVRLAQHLLRQSAAVRGGPRRDAPVDRQRRHARGGRFVGLVRLVRFIRRRRRAPFAPGGGPARIRPECLRPRAQARRRRRNTRPRPARPVPRRRRAHALHRRGDRLASGARRDRARGGRRVRVRRIAQRAPDDAARAVQAAHVQRRRAVRCLHESVVLRDHLRAEPVFAARAPQHAARGRARVPAAHGGLPAVERRERLGDRALRPAPADDRRRADRRDRFRAAERGACRYADRDARRAVPADSGRHGARGARDDDDGARLGRTRARRDRVGRAQYRAAGGRRDRRRRVRRARERRAAAGHRVGIARVGVRIGRALRVRLGDGGLRARRAAAGGGQAGERERTLTRREPAARASCHERGRGCESEKTPAEKGTIGQRDRRGVRRALAERGRRPPALQAARRARRACREALSAAIRRMTRTAARRRCSRRPRPSRTAAGSRPRSRRSSRNARPCRAAEPNWSRPRNCVRSARPRACRARARARAASPGSRR
ncbi:hypothetical protein BURPS1710b_A1880 [Burkholderia pseudomallei 1710b]|uniref:Uncharacterized protein n=1 Tax=Burkholderia pseudomallei (strain 1710b) TaxID=320372 RepID=Q3JHB8_BURP1|nr:hypothetical protein BURPS1710b_A1880 [Burkholderia pseudomallei 1710b]